MAAVPRLPPSQLPAVLPEQHMLVFGVSWATYVLLRDAIDTPGLRMTYCEGILELMSPSRDHQLWKKTIARLIEVCALLQRLPLVGYGPTTLRDEAKERRAEPDECRRVGSIMRDGELPEIVLEVIYTSPLLDKLRVYDGLGVPEVWLWKDGAFSIHHRLAAGGYERAERSSFLPQIDFALVTQFVTREDQDVALQEFAALVRGA
jgi:Uma2 family endonuclease